MKHILVLTSVWSLFILAQSVYAEEWPQGLSFVGLHNEKWQLYVVEKNRTEPRIVPTVSEPRTPTYHSGRRIVSYIAADGSLREHGMDGSKGGTLLKSDSKHAYTQPAYDPTGELLYVVELKEGASVDTDILVLDKSRKKSKAIVKQRSAQFEPMAPNANELFYSNVLCTVDCGKIIQEIWQMDVVSGEAKQVTLVNSIARQPFVSRDGKWLYFSSNKKGPYHVWRMNLKTQEYEQLTQGNVTDVSPVLDQKGNLYFIRRSSEGVQLMYMTPDGELSAMTLPEGISDLRDLEISG